MATSPTQRSLAYARAQGWSAAVVEKWNPYAKIRQDLFGIVDIIILTDAELIGVQATSGGNHAARRDKALASPHYEAWTRVAAFEVWSWAKQGPAGTKKKWSLRRERLDFLMDGATKQPIIHTDEGGTDAPPTG